MDNSDLIRKCSVDIHMSIAVCAAYVRYEHMYEPNVCIYIVGYQG